MFYNYSLWKNILLFFSSIYLTIAINHQRGNLAPHHPCFTINKRLGPYIKWTERLSNTQHIAQKDACGQTHTNGPACCTNEIFDSYAISLGNDLKNLFDSELNQLQQLFSSSTKILDTWTEEYLNESHHLTVSSLKILFGIEEYRNINHILRNLFDTLGNYKSIDTDVSKSITNLFDQLIISTYRQFMNNKHNLIIDEEFKKCLINTAYRIKALYNQPELLYTLTSANLLINITKTLFIYIDADIQRLKTTVTFNTYQCLQRYVREALCPICVTNIPSYIDDINEPLCENDCKYVIKYCFNQTENPYVAFAFIAQGYSNIIKEIQEFINELKLVERLSKLHIYLHDMVINAINTKNIYNELQKACPNSHEKLFSRIESLPPIPKEQHEFIIKWNESLHFMLDKLQSSIEKLNTSLTQQVINGICSNSNYAVKSNRCIQIDQHAPTDFSQWPIPIIKSNSQIILNLHNESTQNQLNELKKKLSPIQQIIESLRPKKKPSLIDYLPDFDYNNEIPINDDNNNEIPSLNIETDENNEQKSLSEDLYKLFDRITNDQTTTIIDDLEENYANHSKLMTYNIILYLFVCILRILLEQ